MSDTDLLSFLVSAGFGGRRHDHDNINTDTTIPTNINNSNGEDDATDDFDTATMSRREQFESSIVHPSMNFVMGGGNRPPSMASASTASLSSSSTSTQALGWTPEEGFGTCFSQFATSCREQTSDPIAVFRHFVTTPEFGHFVQDCGVGFESFTPNPHAAVQTPLFEKFRTVLMASQVVSTSAVNNTSTLVSSSENDTAASTGIADQACLAIVFHGTAEHNVQPILENGLDPTKRSGQAYGPGEYFSKDPSISVPYCKDGKQMMVRTKKYVKCQHLLFNSPHGFFVDCRPRLGIFGSRPFERHCR